jgi:hypothetical protein
MSDAAHMRFQVFCMPLQSEKSALADWQSAPVADKSLFIDLPSG